ncbi:MAG: FAD-dependent oxidoreductase [Deinococcales bacterium]
MMKEPSQKPSKEHSKEYSKESYEVLIIGGGAGGVAAALALAKLGHRVLLSEASDWLGGQLTSQGVPPDEHPWIEAIGATGSYRRFREGVRQYYRQHYPLNQASNTRCSSTQEVVLSVGCVMSLRWRWPC